MRIMLEESQPFNLDLTLCCGQVFRWEKIGKWWYGVVNNRAFKVRQVGKFVEFENASADFLKEYFGLSDDLPMILSQIAKDKHMKNIFKILNGLRILRQNPWECLISYICATYKNITAIKQTLFNLCKKFGSIICLDQHVFYTFPTTEHLAKADLNELAKCGLGYRAKYVSETAKTLADGSLEIEKLKNQSYEKGRSILLSLPGVGLKVADCVLLFSFGKLEAFPVDVWVKRAVIRHYASHFDIEFIRKVSLKKSLTHAEYEKISLFGRKYFGKYAGYAQEYIYHFERANPILY